jgi:hypothetical protein
LIDSYLKERYQRVAIKDKTNINYSNWELVKHGVTKLNNILADVHEWFKKNLLSLNPNKTTYLQFLTKNSQKLDSNVTLMNNQITSSTNTKFIGLTIDKTLSWKCHINQIWSRLSSACYAIRVITLLMTEDTLRMIYHSYVHPIITWHNFEGEIHHTVLIFLRFKYV